MKYKSTEISYICKQYIYNLYVNKAKSQPYYMYTIIQNKQHHKMDFYFDKMQGFQCVKKTR